MNIVMAASEAVPYAKTGGLADVVGALPQELVKLGHQVTVILPCYTQLIKAPRRLVTPLGVRADGRPVEVTLEEVARSGASVGSVRVLLVRHDPFFDRPGLYQTAEGDFPDNLDRFALFSKAVLEAVRFLDQAGERADLLHLHDWQTALCAVYLKTAGYDDGAWKDLRTLLTIHNIGYQGVFPGNQFPKTGLPAALFSPTGLEFYGSVNLLKGGILFSDAVSTVSPTYAKEILTPAFGCGLEGVLATRQGGVAGIANGIDVAAWNPATDRYLSDHYSVSDVSGKRLCKRALQQELGLPQAEVPLLGAIGRLTPQKGFDLLLDILPELMTLDLQVVILGTGDKELERRLNTAKSRYRDRLGLLLGFDEGLAHRIEAGADMVVMPSRYEPCGLTQLYSLRYGTIPIVRRTGGLADTVVPFKPSTVRSKQATGFHVIEASGDALLTTILLALHVHQKKETWASLMSAGMNTDVSWTHAAERYVEFYESIRKGTRSGT